MIKTDNKFFYKMLITFSIIVALTVAVLSSILYINFENITTNLIYSTSKEKLYQSSYSVKFLSEIVEGTAMNINSDNAVKSLMLTSLLDPIEMNHALGRLQAYRFASPMIHSIYVYNRRTSEIFVSASSNVNMISNLTDFYDKEILDQLPEIHNFKRFSPIPRRVKVPTVDGATEDSNVYTYIYYDLYSNTNFTDNIVILNISASWLFNTISAMDVDSNIPKETLIIDGTGKTVFSLDPNKIELNLDEENYIKRILNSNKDSDYFLDKINGQKNLVTYVKSGYYDWNFISVIPFDSVVERINGMRSITLLVTVVLLFISISTSLFLSKKIYTPIQLIFTRLSTLEREKLANRSELKEKLLSDLLSGRVDENSKKAIDEFYTSGDLAIDCHSTLVVIMLKVDDYADLRSRFEYEKRKAIKFKVYQALKTVLFPNQNTEFIDLGAGKLIVLVNYNEPSDSAKLLKESMGDGIILLKDKILEIAGSTFSIFVSPPGHTYRDLPYIYTEVEHLSKYGFFFGRESVIYPSDVIGFGNNMHDYPHDKEKDLAEAIALEKPDLTAEIYRQILEEVGIVTEDVCRHILNQLFFVTKRAFLSKVNDINVLSGVFDSFYEKLQKVEILTEANLYFEELFKQIFDQFYIIKKMKYDELINFITAYVEENYSLNTLSVNVIADEVNMSAAFIGKLFKQLTSRSIPDLISETRLNKSKELLSSTNISINEIAGTVGFTNSSYFYMVFKKEYGVTPSQYRQKYAT
jgi:two-component system, response regulator YesN